MLPMVGGGGLLDIFTFFLSPPNMVIACQIVLRAVTQTALCVAYRKVLLLLPV